MSIKDEIQGPKGYLKEVRDEYMPDTKQMAKLAFDRFELYCKEELTPDFVAEYADEILRDLFLYETEIFIEKNSAIMHSVLPYYYANIFGKNGEEYPESNDRMERLVQIYNNCQQGNISIDYFISNISEVMVPIVDVVSFSQKQSAKARVGESLQNHLSTILSLCKIPHETQQQKIEGGTIMDFAIPNFAAIEEMPDQVLNIECQTTLKDRFRLTTGKSTDAKIKRYLATVSGAGIVTKRDPQDFTVDKIKEIIMDNNVTLVVFQSVKEEIVKKLHKVEEKMKAGKRVQAAAVTMEELEKLIKLSDKKIISYSELVKRDAKSVMIYWQ